MTTWTTNLEIPHLDQNVAQPEIPENVAKNILDEVFAGMNTTDFTSDADLTFVYVPDPKLAQPWHSFVQEFIDDTTALTATRTVTFPVNNRPYLLINNTDQTLNFKVTGSATSISLANGGTNMYCYSDGTDLIKFDFTDSATLISLSDTPAAYSNTRVLRSTAAGTEWYDIVTDLAAKLAHTGGTATTLTLAGTTTNSGTVDGGIASDLELKDFGVTEQTVTSTSNAMTIDLANGNHVYYAAIEATTITITSSSHTSTSFKLLINDGATSAPTFPSVKWAGGTAPTWTTGDDLVEFTMINSIWIGHAIALNVY